MSPVKLETEQIPDEALIDLAQILGMEGDAEEMLNILELGTEQWLEANIYYANPERIKNRHLVQNIDSVDDNLEDSDGVDARNFEATLLTRSGYAFKLYCYRTDDDNSMQINGFSAYRGEDYEAVCLEMKKKFIEAKFKRVFSEVMNGSTPAHYTDILEAFERQIAQSPGLCSQRDAVKMAAALGDEIVPSRNAGIRRAGM